MSKSTIAYLWLPIASSGEAYYSIPLGPARVFYQTEEAANKLHTSGGKLYVADVATTVIKWVDGIGTTTEFGRIPVFPATQGEASEVSN